MEEYVGGFYRPRQEVVHPLVLMFYWRETSHMSSFFPTTIRKSENEDLLVCPKKRGRLLLASQPAVSTAEPQNSVGVWAGFSYSVKGA